MTYNGSRLWQTATLVIIATAIGGYGVRNLALADPGGSTFPLDWYFSDQLEVRKLEGQSAPDLNVQTWIGEPQTLGQMRGRIVVLDLWAAWCAPCLQALSIDARIVSKYADRGVTLIGVHDATERSNKLGGWDRAKREIEGRQIRYAVGLDSSDEKDSTRARYKLESWPTYVVIDRRGIVRATGLKPDNVEDVVRILLDEKDVPAEAHTDEFSADLYLGGRKRPPSVREMEGKVVPALAVDEWLGTPQDPSLSAGVTIVHFWSPTNYISVGQLDVLRAVEPELIKRGSRLIAVCDRRADWAAAKKLAASGKWSTSIARDAAPVSGESAREAALASSGKTVADFGVPVLAVTIVVDRSAVVRAAGVNAKKVLDVVDAVNAHPASGFVPADSGRK